MSQVLTCLVSVSVTTSSSASDSGNLDQGADHLEGVRGDGVVLTLGVHEQHQLRAAKELRARYVFLFGGFRLLVFRLIWMRLYDLMLYNTAIRFDK